MTRVTCLILIAGWLYPAGLCAQSTEQLWLDYIADYPFANKYLLELEASYQTISSGQEKWKSYSLAPDFEVTLFPFMDLISTVPVMYTNQTSTYSTFETRLQLGTRFYFTPGKRVETRARILYEHRLFKEIGGADWQISNRTRIMGELTVPINRNTFYQDKMWYGIFDGEVFFVFDKNVNERFANILRLRAGLGYRLNYSYRFEAIFTSQSSRNEIDHTDVTYSSILQIRLKHYLNKAQPAIRESDDN